MKHDDIFYFEPIKLTLMPKFILASKVIMFASIFIKSKFKFTGFFINIVFLINEQKVYFFIFFFIILYMSKSKKKIITIKKK